MTISKKDISKNILLNSIGTGVYLLCQWLITFIVVWVSGYETAGILSISMSVSTTFCVIATFNMRNFQSSDLEGKYSEKTYLVTRLFTSIVAIFAASIYSLVKEFSTTQILCINAYMIFKISEAIVDVLQGSLQKKWRFDIICISYISRGIISLALFSLALYFTDNLLLALIMMSVGVYLFVIFYDIREYKHIVKQNGDFIKKDLFRLLIKCIPMVIYGLLFSYVAMYPKIVAEGLYGATKIGYYASVATPALIIQVAASFIFTPLISLFAEYFNNNDYKKFNFEMCKVLFLIGILCIIALIGSHFFASWVLNILFGSEILPYTHLFTGVIIASTLTAVIWFLGMLLVVIRKTFGLVIGSVIPLIVACLVTPIMLEKYELGGINDTLIVSYLIQIVIFLICIVSKTKSTKDEKSICFIRSTSIINDSRATKEITSIIKQGYKIIVIGWDRDNRIGNYKQVTINNYIINCDYFKFKTNYGSSTKTVFGVVLFQLWLFFILIKEIKKFNCIHACDFDCGLISLIISELFDKKIVYDIYDYYTDSRELPVKLETTINRLENMIINNADTTIICGEWRKAQIHNARPRNLEIVYNSPDITDLNKYESIIKSKSSRIKIAYVGILQEHRLLLEITNMLENSDRYELHIGGFGKYENEIRKKSENSNNIFYYGSLDYNNVLSLENECDVLFATYDPKIKNHKYSAPNKVYEAMALGKPIIVCKGTGIDEFVTKNKIGIAINYSTVDFIDALNKIFSENNNLLKNSILLKNMYNEKYSWKIMEVKLSNIYKNLFSCSKKGG